MNYRSAFRKMTGSIHWWEKCWVQTMRNLQNKSLNSGFWMINNSIFFYSCFRRSKWSVDCFAYFCERRAIVTWSQFFGVQCVYRVLLRVWWGVNVSRIALPTINDLQIPTSSQVLALLTFFSILDDLFDMAGPILTFWILF